MSSGWSELFVIFGSIVVMMAVVFVTYAAIMLGKARLREGGWPSWQLGGLLAGCVAAGTWLGWQVSAGITDRGAGVIVFMAGARQSSWPVERRT